MVTLRSKTLPKDKMMSNDTHSNRAGQRAGYHPFSLGAFLLWGKCGQMLLRGKKMVYLISNSR